MRRPGSSTTGRLSQHLPIAGLPLLARRIQGELIAARKTAFALTLLAAFCQINATTSAKMELSVRPCGSWWMLTSLGVARMVVGLAAQSARLKAQSSALVSSKDSPFPPSVVALGYLPKTKAKVSGQTRLTPWASYVVGSFFQVASPFRQPSWWRQLHCGTLLFWYFRRACCPQSGDRAHTVRSFLYQVSHIVV